VKKEDGYGKNSNHNRGDAMSDNIVEFPTKEKERDPLAFMIGPFEILHCVIEGRRIPRLTACKTDAGINLIVDGRMGIMVPPELAEDVAWLVAQALAVGAGYSNLEAENQNRCFTPKVLEVGSITT
jgi:hypothetical protein